MTDVRDVVVIGAGTAGAAAAHHCARRGLDTLVLERGDLDSAGARWVNGVARGAFAEAGIEPPTGEELRGEGEPMQLVAGWDGPMMTVEHDVLEVDMRLLAARLRGLATGSGAELRGGVTVRGWEDRAAGRLATSTGAIATRWVVDASGLRSAGLIDRPDIPPEHLCVAAQAVFDCADAAAAEAWFASRGSRFGPALVFAGVAGGFSIVNVRCDGREVSVLTGSIAGSPHPSGSELLRDFVGAHAWIGAERFGGARAIPLRRPVDVLGDDRTALLGDAASQVFSAHGSGIGPGLVAARVLADALADGVGPRGYGVRWMRTHGGLFAAYDLFRRYSEKLTPDDLAALVDAGLMDPATSRAALEQRLPPVSLRIAVGKARGALRAPRHAIGFLPLLPAMQRARRLYARYPEDPDDVPAWASRVARLFGE